MPAEARPAWDAYLAMEQSKQAHFNALQSLEVKHREGDRHTLAETANLAGLLAEHDERVQRFRRLTKELQITDLVAYQSLIQQITSINTELGVDKKPV